jgi:tRNA pseudouridine38-40 synthase
VPDKSRVAVKLAYDGSKFYGYQRQPGKRTVEGCLIDALVCLGAVESAKAAVFQSSSRTDRGVGAIGNVVAFTTGFSLKGLCSAINSETEDLWALSAAKVREDFNPRWARQRWYRYHVPRSLQDLELMRELARRFEGTHDFSGFSRKDGRDSVRTIDSIEVSESGRFLVIDFRAESYLWNMVRRIVWMVDAGSTGTIEAECVGPDAPRPPKRIGLAPAERLLLMDVDCGVEFPPDPKASDYLRSAFEERFLEHLFDEEFTNYLLRASCR